MSGLYYDQQEKHSEMKLAEGIREEAEQFNMSLSEYLLFQILKSNRDMQAELHGLYNLLEERTK